MAAGRAYRRRSGRRTRDTRRVLAPLPDALIFGRLSHRDRAYSRGENGGELPMAQPAPQKILDAQFEQLLNDVEDQIRRAGLSVEPAQRLRRELEARLKNQQRLAPPEPEFKA